MSSRQTPLGLHSLSHRQTARQSPVTVVDRWLAGKILSLLGDPPITITLWGQRSKVSSAAGESPQANVVIHDRKTLYRLMLLPDIAFGDAFTSGHIEVEGELATFLAVTYRARNAVRGKHGLWTRLGGLLAREAGNSLRQSRENIQHHYDLGNEFYRLWLDDEMVYTCAYYDQPELSLEQAQLNKMEHICRKLQLRSGQQVVEAGCGWGALARYMARNHAVRVRAFNISREQVQYARWRARTEGLDQRIEYIEDDYRNLSGRYDAFVSVGMLEHVGVDHYRELGGIIQRSLRERGFGLLHSIGRNSPRPNSPWTEKRIFPGSRPPSLSQMMEILEPYDLSVLDVENLRLHYARTLEHWLERFSAQEERVRALYDQAFVNAWRLYLTASATAFRTGSLQLFQVLFTPDANDAVPYTRRHLYR